MASESHGQSSAKSHAPSIKETFGLDAYRFTKGKWLLLGIAALMVAVGVLLGQKASDAAPGVGATAPSATGSLGSSFAETRPTPSAGQTAQTASANLGTQDWSVFLVKGAFGAFIGFAIGFALRSFLRLAVVMLGFYFLTLTLMSYAGWVDIHWDVMQEQFHRSVTTLGEQFTSFKAFLTGAIPSSGMAALGLTWGLRRR